MATWGRKARDLSPTFFGTTGWVQQRTEEREQALPRAPSPRLEGESDLQERGAIPWGFVDDPELGVVAERLDGQKAFAVQDELAKVFATGEREASLSPHDFNARDRCHEARQAVSSYQGVAHAKAGETSIGFKQVTGLHGLALPRSPTV